MEKNYAYSGILMKSFNHVMESFSSIKVTNADIQIPMKKGISCDITVHIGLVGDIEADVIMSMNAVTGMALASEMLGGMDLTEIDELVVSAVAEFCNIVMGNACTSFTGQKITVDITPPIVLAGQIEEGSGAEPSYNIEIHLNNLGHIEFGVSLQKVV